MKKNFRAACIRIMLIIFISISSVNTYGQFYEWAFSPGFVTRGSYGSFESTDMHGNGYFFRINRPCMICFERQIQCYSPGGQVVWSIQIGFNVLTDPILYSVDADYANNRYVLMEMQTLPYQLGNFAINDTFCLVKYNSAGTPVRVTALPEKYIQVETDSIGNAFVSTGTKVRRYNKFGLFSWEYNAGFEHKLYLDIYKNNYLVNDSIAVKLNPSGVLKYTKVEAGGKTVDAKGRLYISTAGGLKRYDKNGIFQWIRPGISGDIQVNSNGNAYAFRNDSIIKYNQAGTIIQWEFADMPSQGIVNAYGDIYFGDSYDPFTTDLQLCPFRMPSLGSFEQWDPSQVWVAKLNGKDAVPFQAAVYTKLVRNLYGWSDINSLCTSIPLTGAGSPLFEYCTNTASSFIPGNQFTIEVSDNQGSFTNAINIGSATTGTIPDTLPFGTAYRLRVVASTPGVDYYANMPFIYNSDITIHPNRADLSLTGVQNICQGASLQLSVAVSDTSGSIDWYESGISIPGSQNQSSITIDSSGYYHATVTNYVCFHQTDTAVVNVNPRPNPVIVPSGPISFCQGDSVVLNVNDVDLTSIRWRLNGVNIPGSHDTTLSVYAAGNYSVRVFNQYGCARTSAPVNVSVPCRTGQMNTGGPEVVVYPNPVSGDAELSLSGIPPNDYIINVSDVSGRIVFSSQLFIAEGISLTIPSSEFAPGVYSLNVINSNLLITRILVRME